MLVTVLLLPYRNIHILQGVEVTDAQVMIIAERGNVLMRGGSVRSA